MEKNIEWYAKTDLSRYKGEYVAISGKRIIAHGTNARKVLIEARKKSPKAIPYLAKVPSNENFILSSSLGVFVNGSVSLQKRKN